MKVIDLELFCGATAAVVVVKSKGNAADALSIRSLRIRS
jgi:hypothetical protein